MTAVHNLPALAPVEAKQAIHENDLQRLRHLLAQYPDLISWRDALGEGLLHATVAFANDVADPEREAMYYRPECAELLIDAGARVESAIWDRVIATGASGMLRLLERKGVLPRTLAIFAALGDLDAVRHCFDEAGALRDRSDDAGELSELNQAFLNACRFKHKAVAGEVLERCIALDPDLGQQIDRWQGRRAFVDYMTDRYVDVPRDKPWWVFVMRQLSEAIDADDLSGFSGWLSSQPWVLDESGVRAQVELIEHAALNGKKVFIEELFDRQSAILRCSRPPRSDAIGYAVQYGHADFVPLLTRVWPLPDDLPHVAAVGDFARVRGWFDDQGRPALGDVTRHFPYADANAEPQSDPPNAQRVLDVALALACLNKHFDIAEFLLGHGADINTNWSTHEPASILHECVIQHNREGAKFLVEHGIDLTIRDYRWNGTAQGWAYHAANDVEVADFLGEAQERREQGTNGNKADAGS